GPVLQPYKMLIIGQRSDAAKVANPGISGNTVHRITSTSDAIALCGRGSIGHNQARASYASNTSTARYLAVVDDDAAGAFAASAIVFSGPATENGTISLWVHGVRVPVGVTDGDTDATMAANAEIAIAANPALMVTAAAVTATLTVTSRHKGEVGNTLDLRHSYADGESLPEGVGLTIPAMAGGTSNPSLTALIAALGDVWYHVWTHPYTDAVSLATIENELASRFGYERSIDGVSITSASGSFGTLVALGDSRNSPHQSIVAQAGPSPLTPPLEFAAEVAAIIAREGEIAPQRPFTTLAMVNALQVAEGDQFTEQERNFFLFDGIATTKSSDGGKVRLERIITTYQTNDAGSPDTAYLQLNTLLQLMYARFSWKAEVARTYPRHNVAQTGTVVGFGQAVVTPRDIRALALGWHKKLQALAIVQDYAQFERDLVVQLSETDNNRIDFILPPTLIPGLYVLATQLIFRF
ncbi:MAG: phage tail sheath subtilisin-like domain-containing protein, partial [Phycisphaerae bacterium]